MSMLERKHLTTDEVSVMISKYPDLKDLFEIEDQNIVLKKSQDVCTREMVKTILKSETYLERVYDPLSIVPFQARIYRNGNWFRTDISEAVSILGALILSTRRFKPEDEL